MTPQERLELFIKSRYKSKTAFAKEIGDSPQLLNKYLNQGGVISNYHKLKQLKKAGLNPEWYLTGEGEMYSQEVKNEIKAKKESEVFKNLSEFIEQAKELIRSYNEYDNSTTV